jgi:hypothetical protein
MAQKRSAAEFLGWANKLRGETMNDLLGRVVVVLVLCATISACGKEGPFGNTPGPRKPQYSLDSFHVRSSADAGVVSA